MFDMPFNQSNTEKGVKVYANISNEGADRSKIRKLQRKQYVPLPVPCKERKKSSLNRVERFQKEHF